MGMKGIKERVTRRTGPAPGQGGVSVEPAADEAGGILPALSARGDGAGLDGLRRKLLGCLGLLGGDTRGFENKTQEQ